MGINRARVWLGGVAGGVVWSLWIFLIGMWQAPVYAAAESQGWFLKQPRYPHFALQWILLLFVVSILLAHLYAWSRNTLGPGPKAALKVGALVGFCAGFPGNFGQAAWSPVPRMLPFGWMLDLWGGAILATLVAAWLYRDAS